MKPSLRPPALFVAVFPLALGNVHAASQTYLSSSPTDTWNTGDLNWDAGVAWGSGNDAIFAGTGETVAVGSVTAHNITFNSANYLLNGGTITLSGATPTISGSANATINSVIDGTAGLTKSGAGVLTLTGANTYTGLTKVLGGSAYGSGTGSSLTLGSAAKINGNLQLGDGTSPGTVSILKMGAANQFATSSILDFQAGTAYTSGAELKLMGFSQTVGGLSSNGRADSVIENGEGETGSGNSILSIDTGANNYSFTGVIRNSWNGGSQNGFGTVGITKKGSGTQTLDRSVANSGFSYTGATTVEDGRLKIVGGSLGSTAVSVSSGAILEYNSNANFDFAANQIFSGAGVVQKTGSSTIRVGINGENDFNLATGGVLDFQGGDLNVGWSRATFANNNGGINLGASGKLHNSDTAMQADWLSGSGDLNNAFNSNLLTLTLGVSGTANNATYGVTGNTATFSGRIGYAETYNGQAVSSISLIKVGTGTQVLTGINGYSGGTTIKNGTLVLAGGNDRLLATGSMTLGDATTSGKLMLGNAGGASNQTFSSLTATGLGGSVVGGNAGTDSVLTLNIASGTSTFGGTLGGAGANENKIALTKTGNGTLEMSGNCTYTGDTIISAGTLLVNGMLGSAVSVSGTLAGSGTVGNVTVNAGGIVAPGNSPGILHTGNYTQTTGTLALELNGTTPGSGYDQLDVTGAVTLGGTLSLTLGYTPANGDLLFILHNDGNDATTSTFSGLAHLSTFFVGDQEWLISYQADANANAFNSAGGNDIALLAVPEPCAALLGSLGLLALLRRRRN